MDTNVFIDSKLNHITNILAKEKNKRIYIAGDFNFDLIKYSTPYLMGPYIAGPNLTPAPSNAGPYYPFFTEKWR